jgi:hypothetical protein
MADERATLRTDTYQQIFEEIERYKQQYPQLIAAMRLFGDTTEWYQRSMAQLYGPRVIWSSSTNGAVIRAAP